MLQARIQDYGLNSVGDGPIYNIESATITRELDGAGRFSFNTPLADERAIELATNERRAILYIYHPNLTNREIGAGIIRGKNESGDNWSINGPDLLAELANENTLVNRAYDGTAITTVLSELIALVRSNHNLCVDGTPSAGSFFLTHVAAHAFDRDPDTYWASGTGTPDWIGYQFSMARAIARYSIQAYQSSGPVAWTLEAFNGATWDVVDTVSGEYGWASDEKRVYDADTPGASSTQWRLSLTEAAISTVIAEITMSPATDWTIDSTGVTGDFYGSFNGVSVLKALQDLANATGYHFRVEADRAITFGPLGDTASLTILQAGTIADGLDANNEIAILDQPLRQLSSEGLINWVMPLGKGTPPLTLEYLQPDGVGSAVVDYDETNLTGWYNLRGSGTDYLGLGQSFEVATAKVIYAVSLYLQRTGSPTGTLSVTLHDVESGLPITGATGVGGAPSRLSEASIGLSAEWVVFWLHTPLNAVAGNRYFIQLRTDRTSADAANFIAWGVDTSPAYADGQAARRPVAGWGFVAADMIFKVWGTTAGLTIYPPQPITGPDGTTQYYLKDDASAAEYGEIKKVLNVDIEPQGTALADLQNAALLVWRAANAWLSKRVNPQTYYSATVQKAYSTIYPGQLIRLVYRGHVYDAAGVKQAWADIDDTFWVTRVAETVDANGNLQARLDLSTIAQAKEDAASRIVSAVESFTVEGIRRFYGPTILDEQSGTVFTPPSGKRKLYPRVDGWYDLDDDGNEIGPLDNLIAVTNTSGGTVAPEDVGYIDEAGEFKTIGTDAYIGNWAVVVAGGANNDVIRVAREGKVSVQLNGNCNAGDYLKLSGTSKRAAPLTYVAPEVFAVALTANTDGAGGTCLALLLCKSVFVPLALSTDLLVRTGISDSDFVATQNGAVSGATLVYNAPSSGGETILDASASTEVGKIVLHNTTRSEEALISDTNTGTNTITVTSAAAIAAWVNTNALTIRSQTNTDSISGAYFMDIELTTDIPALAYSLLLSVPNMSDTGGAGAYVMAHPYSAGVNSKRARLCQTVATGQHVAPPTPIDIINRRFCLLLQATGAGALTAYLRVAGCFVKAP